MTLIFAMNLFVETHATLTSTSGLKTHILLGVFRANRIPALGGKLFSCKFRSGRPHIWMRLGQSHCCRPPTLLGQGQFLLMRNCSVKEGRGVVVRIDPLPTCFFARGASPSSAMPKDVLRSKPRTPIMRMSFTSCRVEADAHLTKQAM